MKKAIALFMLLSSFQVFAVEIHNCDIVADKKMGTLHSRISKKVFLSRNFTNRVDFAETVLDLTLTETGAISGAVNGQRNFILRGNATSGSFESATHTGTISCSESFKVDSLFHFKPWRQFFSLDEQINRGHIQTRIDQGKIKNNLVCFIGNAHKAALEISGSLKNTEIKVISGFEIQFTFETKDCVRSQGTNPDDIECLEWKEHTITKSMFGCFSDPR